MTASTPSPGRYGVVGNPIAHSWSPAIHEAFGRETGRALRYERLLAPIEPAGGFEALVGAFFAGGGKGLNVTVPFKERAFRLSRERTPRAEAAGACNTLLPVGAGVLGDNTDGAGLVADIEGRLGVPLAGKRLLLLGAGGAARGVLRPLLERGPAALTIANRTVARAEALLDGLSDPLPDSLSGSRPDSRPDSRPERIPLAALPLAALTEPGARPAVAARFDIVIDGTAAGLAQPLPMLDPSVFEGCELGYDMVYSAEPTGFLRQAAAAGVPRLSDGLGMLVEQAALAFSLWHGVMPATAPVYDEIRRQVAERAAR